MRKMIWAVKAIAASMSVTILATGAVAFALLYRGVAHLPYAITAYGMAMFVIEVMAMAVLSAIIGWHYRHQIKIRRLLLTLLIVVVASVGATLASMSQFQGQWPKLYMTSDLEVAGLLAGTLLLMGTVVVSSIIIDAVEALDYRLVQ